MADVAADFAKDILKDLAKGGLGQISDMILEQHRMPDHRATLDEALRGYTSGGVYAGFSETEIGTLEPGKKADLIILSDDLGSLQEDAIADISVQVTICDGTITWAS